MQALLRGVIVVALLAAATLPMVTGSGAAAGNVVTASIASNGEFTLAQATGPSAAPAPPGTPTAGAPPQSPPATILTDKVYPDAFRAIFVLFVLAVVLESALAVVFNWRPFVETFNPRAVRPLVAFVVSLVVVTIFQLDIATSLFNAVTNSIDKPNATGMILTALVIAGGSAGVNKMLVALGYREIKTPETTAPKPSPTKAWIAVRATRIQVRTGDIEVFLGKDPAAGAPALPPRVGTITGASGGNWLAYFLSDLGRFPHYGGFYLDPAGGPYLMVLRGKAEGQPVEFRWGPQDVAAGAIIDVTADI